MKTHKKAPSQLKTPLFAQYIEAFTDDVGIFQHSIYGVPNLHHGYTTDDNARALLLAVLLYERSPKTKYLKMITKYLAFLVYAQNDDGKFKNFMNFQRTFVESVGSEDCFGRCTWVLGRTLSATLLPDNIKRSAMHAMNKIVENWTSLSSPRAKALCLVGLSSIPQHKESLALVLQLSESLILHYNNTNTDDWHWFENYMTYGNSFLPMAMFKAYEITKDPLLLQVGTQSMDFLESQTMTPDFFRPIGSNGWLHKGKSAALCDEQPIEAGETTLTYLSLYKISHKKKHLRKAKKCLRWYTGQNSKKLSLIDSETGACYDGLNTEGLNLNQGSECILMYGIAWLEMEANKYD